MKQYEVKTLLLSNGETIAYRECGHGDKTIILVHGNMSSSVHFQTTMEALENDYKVYAVDMRDLEIVHIIQNLIAYMTFQLISNYGLKRLI